MLIMEWQMQAQTQQVKYVIFYLFIYFVFILKIIIIIILARSIASRWEIGYHPLRAHRHSWTFEYPHCQVSYFFSFLFFSFHLLNIR